VVRRPRQERVSKNDAPDSNDALDRAVSRVEEVALPRAFYGEMAILYAAGWLNATAVLPLRAGSAKRR